MQMPQRVKGCDFFQKVIYIAHIQDIAIDKISHICFSHVKLPLEKIDNSTIKENNNIGKIINN
jgi:hypothetical protein